ncbi:MAG: AAA family ATPase [Mariniphaga sp.]
MKRVNPQNIFHINKEYSAFDEIKSSADLDALFMYYRQQFNLTGKIYIFLDEVQNILNWETFTNSYSQDFTGEITLKV